MQQQRAETSKTVRVRVERAFFYEAKVHKVGSIADLPRNFAAEMIAANKAIPAPEGSINTPAGTARKADD